MPLDGEYEPSPSDWVREQVEAFEASDGAEANELQGVPIVVVTMQGARSGKLRKVPVMRVEHGGEYVMVASKGGAPENPAWYHNLVRHPDVVLQDGATRTDLTAQVVDGDDRSTWWQRATAVWPDYDEYQTKTDRQIPVFVLSAPR